MKTGDGSRKESLKSRHGGPGEELGPESGQNRVGSLLRQAREAQNLTIQEVARDLHIRQPLLDAMEREDMDNLPGQTFAVGFLKLYIRYLKLPDEQTLIAQFIARMQPQDLKLYYAPPDTSSRNRPGPVLVTISLLIFLGIFVGYEIHLDEQPLFSLNGWRQQLGWLDQPEKAGSGESSLTDALMEKMPKADKVPEKIPEKVAATEKGWHPLAALEPVPVPKPAPPPAKPEPTPVKPDKALTDMAVAAKPAVVSKPEVVAEPPPEDETDDFHHPAKVAHVADSGQAVLVADEKVWVQIKNRERQVIKEVVLKEGETLVLGAEDFALLTVGNAGGVRLRLAGQESAPLGPKGKVLRNMDISHKGIVKKMGGVP